MWDLLCGFVVCGQIFTRILRSFNLPVGTSQMVVPKYLTNSYDIGHVVLWISAMLVSHRSALCLTVQTISQLFSFCCFLYERKSLLQCFCINISFMCPPLLGRCSEPGPEAAQWPLQQHYLLLPPFQQRPLAGEIFDLIPEALCGLFLFENNCCPVLQRCLSPYFEVHYFSISIPELLLLCNIRWMFAFVC